jgi:uncharacterized protein YcsI (UPF0317 family)
MTAVQELLKDRNTQSGSPWNTFTEDELNALRAQLPGHNLPHPVAAAQAKVASGSDHAGPATAPGQVNILDPNWAKKPVEEAGGNSNSEGKVEPTVISIGTADVPTDPQKFRELVRSREFVSPTNAVCPGHLQCNLVVLPQGKESFDFLLFCQRNKKACPLIEVCDVGSPHPHGVAQHADLRTDVPKYCIYRNGELVEEVTDATPYWPENSVAFLIGCSFSYDGELMNAGIPLRSAEQGKNVPMYRSNIPCRSAGSLKGNMVVSMKPISALDVAKEVEITNKYPHAHGGPVCVGCPEAIGIQNLNDPDWGDAVEMQPGEVPVFHACGVTPQSVLMDSKVPFAITHSAGYMFVTDLPSHEVP